MTIKGQFAGLRDLNNGNFLGYFNNTDKTMSIRCFSLSFYERGFGNISEQDQIGINIQ